MTFEGIAWITPLLVLIYVNVCIAAVSLVVQMSFTRYQMDAFSRSFVI
eukprot:gene2083-1517_t